MTFRGYLQPLIFKKRQIFFHSSLLYFSPHLFHYLHISPKVLNMPLYSVPVIVISLLISKQLVRNSSTASSALSIYLGLQVSGSRSNDSFDLVSRKGPNFLSLSFSFVLISPHSFLQLSLNSSSSTSLNPSPLSIFSSFNCSLLPYSIISLLSFPSLELST